MIALLRCGTEFCTEIVEDKSAPEGVKPISVLHLVVRQALLERGVYKRDQVEGKTVDSLLKDGWRFPRRAPSPPVSTDCAVTYLYLEYR